MQPSASSFKTGLLVMISTAFVMLYGSGSSATGAAGSDSAIQVAKDFRPAAKGESPEEAAVKALPSVPQPEALRRPSKAELLDRCGKLPNCRQKLDAAQKGVKPTTPRPAATAPSPEELQLKQLPQIQPGPIPHRIPKSELRAPTPDFLLSWLNPFHVAAAQAQSGFSVTLTPTQGYIASPYSYLSIFGGIHAATGQHALPGYLSIQNPSSPNSFTHTENKPYAYFPTSVPATGWYLINVRGSRGAAKLRHLASGPIIETWDFTPSTFTCNPCDYLTTEYLQAGSQYFYFWPTSIPPLRIDSVSIESYP